jgi:hypothetical protein
MRRIWPLALLVGIALRVSAQTQADPSTIFWMLTQKGVDGKQDLESVWKTLGISGQMRETTSAGVQPTDLVFGCEQGCTVKSVASNEDLLLEDGFDEITLISTGQGAYCRLLLFHENNRRWRLVDYLDIIGSRYGEPSVNIVTSGGKRWLVTSAYYGGGTGVALKQSDWYELRGGKFRHVLGLPAEGHDINDDPARFFNTSFMMANTKLGRESLEFVFHVRFKTQAWSDKPEALLWEQESTVVYTRLIGQTEFRYDRQNSKLTMEFADRIFAYDIEKPDLYPLLSEQLLGIARGARDWRRAWLKQLLDRERDLPSLVPVRKAFANAR